MYTLRGEAGKEKTQINSEASHVCRAALINIIFGGSRPPKTNFKT